ncbi:MAG: DUF3883 domain-containing protein, partial [Planctomycetota bacterium]
RVPRHLWPIGDKLEPRFGRLGKEYKQIVFDKALLAKDPTSEWVTPGHPLFETVREALWDRVREDLERGTVFYDLHSADPYHLDVYSASVKDGLGNELHRRLFVVESTDDARLAVREPTVFLDLAAAPKGTETPADDGLPSGGQREHALVEKCLNGFLAEIAEQRRKETDTILQHIETSLNELIHRQQMTFAGLTEQQPAQGATPPWLAASLKQCEDRLDELNSRRERRLAEIQRERECSIGGIQHVGRAWVLPHPERSDPKMQPMVRDDEIEKIAVQAVSAHEEAQGRQVESVEAQNRGFDLISRRPHPEDPATAIDVRFIEVKGRGSIGEVALTTNEYKTADRLKNDYWLYVVYNCGSEPDVHVICNPARLGWKPIVAVEHYTCDPKSILAAEKH